MMFSIPWDEHKVACDEGEFEDVSLMMMCIVRNQWNIFTTPNAAEPAPVGDIPNQQECVELENELCLPFFYRGDKNGQVALTCI
jgi:hypothetical protein